jgi:hypothetical protein
VPAIVNLADLDRARGLDEQGAELLRKAIAVEPNNADVVHSLGLFLVRQQITPAPWIYCNGPTSWLPITRDMPMSMPSR